MINSKFTLDVLNLLCDGDEEGISARLQINFLTEKEYTYTGAGLYIDFFHTNGIDKYKYKDIDYNITGVVINSPDLKFGADARLFLKKGLIEYLEIGSRDGNYPSYELQEYTITQEWIGSPNKKIESNK